MSDAPAPEPSPAAVPPPQSRLTARVVVMGVLVAAVLGGCFPYVVLKIGFGPTISVVAAFLAFLGLKAVAAVTKVPTGRFEYNLVQTAGTTAAEMAFMCVVLAAFDMLSARPNSGFDVHVTPLQVFVWMTLAGGLGVLLAVPLRRHYIDEEQLTFADGTAAGETLLVLDAGDASAKKRVKVLAWGALFSFVTTWLRDGMAALRGNHRPGSTGWPPKWLEWLTVPQSSAFFPKGEALHLGIAWSALEVGAGLIVGLRVTLSLGLGMVLAWYLAPGALAARRWIPAETFQDTLRWVMWPATGLMVAGGLTQLVVKWRLIARTLKDLGSGRVARGSDLSLRWVAVGVAVLSVALVVQQYVSMGIPIWQSVVALLVSVVLMLVGIRVLGETNWAPISAMANMVQALFALLAPGNVAVNMVASGMSGTVAGSGETLMQDFKAGKIIGNDNRLLTQMQLIATPVGAAAMALVYPLLRAQYGIGPGRYGIDPSRAASGAPGLTSPISVKWAGFAELLQQGVSQLEPHALQALVVCVVLGVGLTLLETRFKQKMPSLTGVALGMLIPAADILPMVLGGVAQAVWAKASPRSADAYATPLASGLIVGEALLALVVPVTVFALTQAHWVEPVGGP